MQRCLDRNVSERMLKMAVAKKGEERDSSIGEDPLDPKVSQRMVEGW